jgi:hypothetical protein
VEQKNSSTLQTKISLGPPREKFNNRGTKRIFCHILYKSFTFNLLCKRFKYIRISIKKTNLFSTCNAQIGTLIALHLLLFFRRFRDDFDSLGQEGSDFLPTHKRDLDEQFEELGLFRVAYEQSLGGAVVLEFWIKMLF